MAKQREGKIMTHYIAVVGRDDDGSAYGIWFPDVPRCHSAADREEDILAMASEALMVHLDGEEPPHARPVGEILQLEEVREDLARGDFLISVPLLLAGGRTKRVTITGETDMFRVIDDAARTRGLTRSAFLMQAARNEIVGRPFVRQDRDPLGP